MNQERGPAAARTAPGPVVHQQRSSQKAVGVPDSNRERRPVKARSVQNLPDLVAILAYIAALFIACVCVIVAFCYAATAIDNHPSGAIFVVTIAAIGVVGWRLAR